MLLSQRIAKDVSFLKLPQYLKTAAQITFDMRMKIVRATKLVVGREFLDTDRHLGQINTQIFGHEPSQDEVQKRMALYARFSRLPWQTFLMENATGAVLVERVSDNTFDVSHILPTGVVFSYVPRVEMLEREIRVNTNWRLPESLMKATMREEGEWERYLKARNEVVFLQTIEVLETLLYVNTKNVVKHHYTPTKKENAAVPKPLLPYYSYYVLDVFHDRKSYQSLQEIQTDHCDPNREVQLRRAGLVRGHFKQRATGLFWWNDYVRNHKNRDTVGAVDKDYRLVNKEEQ